MISTSACSEPDSRSAWMIAIRSRGVTPMVFSARTTCANVAAPEMKTSFFRPAMPGALRGVGRVVRWGKTIAFTEGELYDAEDRLVAKATGTAVPTPFKNYK